MQDQTNICETQNLTNPLIKQIPIMRPEFESIPLHDNKAENRFEMKFENYTSFIEYEIKNGAVALLHTEVDPALEGRGTGTAIVEKTLKHIEEAELKLLPLCPFVATYLKRHPGWEKLVAS